MHQTWVINMRTGALLQRVFPYDFPWSASIDGSGEGTASFVIGVPGDANVDPGKVPTLFRPNLHGLAVLWGTHVEYAGKIQDWDYDRGARRLAVSTVELPQEFKQRLTYGVIGYELGTLTVTDRSITGAVRAVLARFMQWSAEWQYPIDLPADGAGTFTATWEFWRKYRISDLLDQIAAEGYEIYLRPYLAGAAVRWETVVAPKVALGGATFILAARESPLKSVKYKLDGSGEVTGIQGLGNGTGQDQQVAWAGAPGGSDIPIRDTKVTFNDLTGDRLQAATNAEYAARQDPLVQWSVGKFELSDRNPPTKCTPGRAWKIIAKNELPIPDGTHALRVISVSGNVKSLELQPEVQGAA